MNDIQLRFWSKVEKTTDCWLWTAYKSPDGYGRFMLKGKSRVASRVAYEFSNGPVKDGFELDHLCRIRACVRPSHLQQVTHRINSLRSNNIMAENARKGSCKRGHAFSEENTSYRPFKTWHKRQCRTCMSQYWKDRWQRTTEAMKTRVEDIRLLSN